MTRAVRSLAVRSMALLAPLAFAAVIVGCAEVDNPYLPYPEPDFETYSARVQPIVEQRCAFSACHGSLDRPLTLYAVGFLRSPPAFVGDPLDERELSQTELAWNFDALRMRLIDETSGKISRLMLKCLDPKAGGIVHAGGVVIFESQDEPDYVAMANWIEAGL